MEWLARLRRDFTIAETEGSILIHSGGARWTVSTEYDAGGCWFRVEWGTLDIGLWSCEIPNWLLTSVLATSRRSARSRSRLIVRLKSPLA